MVRRRSVFTAGVLAVSLAIAGCGGSSDSTATPTPTPSPSAAASFPVTVGSVTLAQRPEKIVSLSPTATEMLFAVGAGKQVTAVDDNSNYPSEAPKTDLSGFQPNAEAIAAKNPDLVIISTDTNKVAESLTKLKIPVYQANAATTLDDTYRQLTEIGTLTGHPTEAATQVQQMKDELGKLFAGVPRHETQLTYYYELDPTYYSATSKTFIGSVLSQLGLRNIADAADPSGKAGGYPQLSAEVIIKANPDLVFLADTKCCKQSADTLKTRPGWANVTAVKNSQVVALDDDIASRWGPRVVDLVRMAAAAVAKVS